MTPARYLVQFIAIVFSAVMLAVWPLLAEADTVRAETIDTHVGIVISYGDESLEFILFEIDRADEISAMDLLIESDLELEISPFGGLGEAVCSIDGTGCPGSDCFCESFSSPAYYWQFFQWDDQQWVPQHQGASQHVMEPGQILGWSWTADPPGLPDVSFDDFLDSPDTDASATTVPDEIILTPDPTPVDTNVADDNQADSGSSLQCLQFISILTIAGGFTALLANRRYGNRESA